jgi:hypothetical protein
VTCGGIRDTDARASRDGSSKRSSRQTYARARACVVRAQPRVPSPSTPDRNKINTSNGPISKAAILVARDEHVLRLDPVLQAVKLPARVTRLDTGLADVDGDDFAHFGRAGGGKTAVLRTTRIVTRRSNDSLFWSFSCCVTL